MAYEYYYGDDTYDFGGSTGVEYDETAPWEEGGEAAAWDESWGDGPWDEWAADETWAEDWEPKEWKTGSVTSTTTDSRKWNVLVNSPTAAKDSKGDGSPRERTGSADDREQSQEKSSAVAGEGNKSGGSGRRKRSASRSPRRRSQRPRRRNRRAHSKENIAVPREAPAPRCHLVPAPHEAPAGLAPISMMAGPGARPMLEPLEPPPGIF
uniref:Uncharacterized protein n=1 Tax=Alexandrium catenella TaxID=2925 RepID=A0A7S1QZ46_ALECA|mmetsp:Transcript_41902/g.113000  ORF Transcript_41902/g.113000 Transcript_41902/m.113000 type:complete len:209 (-) Transcript_41902:101-727(-)